MLWFHCYFNSDHIIWFLSIVCCDLHNYCYNCYMVIQVLHAKFRFYGMGFLIRWTLILKFNRVCVLVLYFVALWYFVALYFVIEFWWMETYGIYHLQFLSCVVIIVFIASFLESVVNEKFWVVVVDECFLSVFNVCCLRCGEMSFIATSVKFVTVLFMGNWMLRMNIKKSSLVYTFYIPRCVDVIISPYWN